MGQFRVFRIGEAGKEERRSPLFFDSRFERFNLNNNSILVFDELVGCTAIKILRRSPPLGQLLITLHRCLLRIFLKRYSKAQKSQDLKK
jgi:hypothetical protein